MIDGAAAYSYNRTGVKDMGDSHLSEHDYDVIIVGAGPAGIFAALELSDSGLRVLLLEKGRDLEERVCPVAGRADGCLSCRPCSMVSGFGGAGAYSDGKLTLSADVGGLLGALLPPGQLPELIEYVDSLYVRFGAPERVFGTGPEVESLTNRAMLAGLRLVPVKIRHLGCENCLRVLEQMRGHLRSRVEIRVSTDVTGVDTDGGHITAVRTASGEKFSCRYLVCAPGREGAEWLTKLARGHGLTSVCQSRRRGREG